MCIHLKPDSLNRLLEYQVSYLFLNTPEKKPVSLRTGLPRALSEPQSLYGRFEIALLLIFSETF